MEKEGKYRGITANQAAWLILLAALLWFGGNWLQYHLIASDMVVTLGAEKPLSTPNVQLSDIAEEVQVKCIAKGYTEKFCKQYLAN